MDFAFSNGASLDDVFKELFKDPHIRNQNLMSFRAALSNVNISELSKYPNLVKMEGGGCFSFFPACKHRSEQRICGYIKDGKMVFTGFSKSHNKAYSELINATKREAAKVAQTGAKAGVKVAAKSAGKATAKTAGKGGLKMVAKKIPIVGALAGILFGAQRAIEGDWTGAGMEVASGAASTLPGFGTAVSVGIDATLIGRDIANER